MLASPNRLKSSRDISRVFSRGRGGTSGPISVRAAKNGDVVSRGVVVVSKKVSKKATVRNKIRRRVAALLATDWATVANGYDIVVTVREDVSQAPIADLTKHLKTAFTKAEVI